MTRVVPAAIVEEVKKAVEKDGGVFPTRSWRYDEARGPIFKSKFDKIIIEAAKKFDVDAALVSAVIKAESDFNAREVSNKGARGLMQLMPSTAERFGVTDSYDPAANIYAGVRYLRWLLQTFHGNADLAVAAYNAGEGNVWKYNGVPPFRETITYINRIAKHIRNAMTAAATTTTKVANAAGSSANRMNHRVTEVEFSVRSVVKPLSRPAAHTVTSSSTGPRPLRGRLRGGSCRSGGS